MMFAIFDCSSVGRERICWLGDSIVCGMSQYFYRFNKYQYKNKWNKKYINAKGACLELLAIKLLMFESQFADSIMQLWLK